MHTKPKKCLRHQWNQGQTKICKKCKQVITQNPGHHLLAVWLFNWRAFLFYWSQIQENNIFSFERLFYQPNSHGSFSFSALYLLFKLYSNCILHIFFQVWCAKITNGCPIKYFIISILWIWKSYFQTLKLLYSFDLLYWEVLVSLNSNLLSL